MIKAIIFDMYETLVTLKSDELYFDPQVFADENVDEKIILDVWNSKEYDRTIGNTTLEDHITLVLKENGKYSEELFTYIFKKRYEARRIPFNSMHKDIIPMLKTLKDKGIKIGLISNSFSEEMDTIKESILYPYFNATCFSFEEHIKKPDPEIFRRIIEKLGVSYDECIYVGDGGSDELEAAKNLGMKALKANWYVNRNLEFVELNNPLEVIQYVE